MVDLSSILNAEKATRQLSMATSKKRKVKDLKASEIKALSQSICKPTDAIATQILQCLKTSRHILLYPERTELCKLLGVEVFEAFSLLVSCLFEDYCELYKSIKGRTKYSDFQVKWLDHVFQVAEKGAAMATNNAQDDSDHSAILPTSLAAEQRSYI